MSNVKWGIIEVFSSPREEVEVSFIRHGFDNIQDAEKRRSLILDGAPEVDPQNIQVVQYTE